MEHEGPSRRIPNLLHVLLFLAVTIAFVCAVEMLTLIAFHRDIKHALLDQKIQLVVTALAYGLTLAAAGVLFSALWGRPFWSTLRWNAAGAKPLLALLGLVLGFLAEAISSKLPTPREMPIEGVFQAPGIIWLLVIFGTLGAPLFEEVVFRGMLLPALANAFDWLRLPHAKTEESELAHVRWRQTESPTRAALVVSSVLTSLLFASIHAPQLGFNWAPVALLVCVSLVLCAVRIRMQSVAASTLVHGFYNLANFVLIFIVTGGFRHLDKA